MSALGYLILRLDARLGHFVPLVCAVAAHVGHGHFGGLL